MRNWMLFCILLACIFFSGCETNSIAYKDATGESINSENNHTYGDKNNRKYEIDNEGYFEDIAGYKFDKYFVSEHFEIYYNSKNELNKFYASNSIKILEEEYDRILKFLDVEDTNMPIVKINMYDEYECLRQSIISETFFDPDDTDINLVGITLNKDTFYFTTKSETGKMIDLKSVLVHEFVHTVTMALTNGKMQIDWLWEGTAKYLSQDRDYSEPYYKEMIDNGIPEMYLLRRNEKYRYIYGYSMVEFIVETYGKEKFIDLLLDYGDIEEVLNVTQREFREVWKTFLKEKMK